MAAARKAASNMEAALVELQARAGEFAQRVENVVAGVVPPVPTRQAVQHRPQYRWPPANASLCRNRSQRDAVEPVWVAWVIGWAWLAGAGIVKANVRRLTRRSERKPCGSPI